MTEEKKRCQKQKEKQYQAKEEVQLEDKLRKLAREERLQQDKKEFEEICKQIVRFVESKGTTDQYLAMAKRLRAPFKMEIKGHSITVSAANTTIMLKQSASGKVQMTTTIQAKGNTL
jgi:hypothetical protein